MVDSRGLRADEMAPRAAGAFETLGQFGAFAGMASGCIVLAMAHLAVLARPLYAVAGVWLALRYRRSSPFAYVTLTLWFWSLSPFVRRVIDYFGHFSTTNIVLITPNILCGIMIWEIVTSRGLLRRRDAALGAVALACVTYGLIVSFARGEVAPGLISASDWFCPLAYFFFFMSHADQIEEAEPYFAAFIPLNMTIIVAYGFFQYISPPPWDVQWVSDSKLTNIGVAVPFGLKPFSTLNDSGLFSVWLAAVLLWSLYFRNALTILALPAALLLLPLTQVRSTTGSALLGFALAVLLGRGRMARSGLLVMAMVVGAAGILALLDPRSTTTLINRFSTIENLGNDQSARARAELYASAPDMIATHPFGLGIGALGRGAQISDSESYPVMDSGPLAIYLALGWFAGTLYMMAFFGVTAQALKAALDCGSPAALALAASAVTVALVILFTNVIGLQGVPMWVASSYAIAIATRSRTSARLSRALLSNGPKLRQL
jgi:hypothetical protein